MTPLHSGSPTCDSEDLGEFETHHEFPELGLSQSQLLFLGICLRPKPALAALEELALPGLPLMRRHSRFAIDLVERVPAEEPQHDLLFTWLTPPLGELRCGRVR